MQTRSPQDIDKTNRPLYKILQAFGQCDRYDAGDTRRPSMTQAALLLNDKIVRRTSQGTEGQPSRKAAEERQAYGFEGSVGRTVPGRPLPVPVER